MNEFTSQKDFVDYLKSLEEAKPFNCAYLRVLPEPVSLDINLPGRRAYDKNNLLCIRSVEIPQNALSYHHCEFHGSLRLNKEGELEAGCNWSSFLGKKWKIKVLG